MAWIGIILKLIPMVIKLMTLAEQAFDGIQESGEQKKQMVLEAVQAVFDALVGASTGGQKETWEKIRPIISSVIDIVCGILFSKEESK